MAARSFRMFGKKRGHRRTGSNTWGSLGEAAVFAVFLALGTLFLVLLLRMPVLPGMARESRFPANDRHRPR